MSTDCQEKTTARSIPATRRVTINDAAHMPHDYCTTPGGTLFSTTPGGTRIIYDRKFLLELRSSPLAKTPPRGLPAIPGVTTPSPPAKDIITEKACNGKPLNNNTITTTTTTLENKSTGDDSLFEMDM